MRYRLLTTIAALALFAIAGVGALWLASYGASTSVTWCHYTEYPDCEMVHRWNFLSAAGGLRFEHQIDHFVKGSGEKIAGFRMRTTGTRSYPFFGTRSLIPGRDKLSFLQQAGFELGDSSTGTPLSVIRGIIVPHWFALIVCAMPLAVWVRQGWPVMRGRRWARRGLCFKCGYDLRAHARPMPGMRRLRA